MTARSNVREQSEDIPPMGSQNCSVFLYVLNNATNIKPAWANKEKAPNTFVFEALIFGTPKGNGRVSNLPPEKSRLPPGEIFPVSPVATLPRTS